MPRWSATRNAGVHGGRAVYLDFANAIQRLGVSGVSAKYGNPSRCTRRSRMKTYKVPMRIYSAIHYTAALGRLQP